VAERNLGSPHRSRVARGRVFITIPLIAVMATGVVAAGASAAGPTDGAPWDSGGGLVADAPQVEFGPLLGVIPSVMPPLIAWGGSTSPVAENPVTEPAAPPAATEPPVAPAVQPARPAGPEARLIYHGSRSRHVVALTFDDGWNTGNAQLIVDILVREHVAATFFVNGVWLPKDPPLWQEIADDGFVVGNHTYAHRDATTMTGWALERDLERNARVWLAATGTPMAPLYRPPYGRRNAATDLAAAEAGYPDIVLWDAVANDTFAASDAQLVRNATAGHSGSIVLMHMGPDATPRILGRVIANYRARGFTFVTVPQLVAPLAPKPVPPAPQPEPSPLPSSDPSPAPSPEPSTLPVDPSPEVIRPEFS
jgi:peptidoglycan/xylan/chitin deacetylase (PgdA/CDA1 family)